MVRNTENINSKDEKILELSMRLSEYEKQLAKADESIKVATANLLGIHPDIYKKKESVKANKTRKTGSVYSFFTSFNRLYTAIYALKGEVDENQSRMDRFVNAVKRKDKTILGLEKIVLENTKKATDTIRERNTLIKDLKKLMKTKESHIVILKEDIRKKEVSINKFRSTLKRKDETIKDLSRRLEEECRHTAFLRSETNDLKNAIDSLKNSATYKVFGPIRKVHSLVFRKNE